MFTCFVFEFILKSFPFTQIEILIVTAKNVFDHRVLMSLLGAIKLSQ